MLKPKIAAFFTGGTISMRVDPETGGAIPALAGEEILALVPGLTTLADVQIFNPGLWPGPHVTPVRMMELAREVAAVLADQTIAGAVITHGTDTLEETAYLLDLVLDLAKPSVLVVAMRNSSELSWDGPANLRAAFRVALSPDAAGLGVLVVMNDQILAASEVVKTHTESTDTFQSRDFGPLGLVDKDRVLVVRRPLRRQHLPAIALEERVDLLRMYAGADGRFIDHAVETGARGLVIEGLGRGNVPVAAIPAIGRAIDRGLPVVIATRCARGRVLDTYGYEGGGRHLTRLGAILAGLLPGHQARLKLMLALGAGWDLARIRAAFADADAS
ncbi:MAG: asparaginase [Blastocatellia bacterium]